MISSVVTFRLEGLAAVAALVVLTITVAWIAHKGLLVRVKDDTQRDDPPQDGDSVT
jgi:hypothetical protein